MNKKDTPPGDMYLREEYISRINRVMDYIEANMEKPLSLGQLAKVANFSRFHFHRIFSAIVGETLNGFIQRVRVEKAASQLLENPKKSITEVALDCGYSGSAAFARAFKDSFNMTASEWRRENRWDNSKICKTEGKDGQTLGNIWQDFKIISHYKADKTKHQTWRIKMKAKEEIKVEVKDMPEFTVAYVRHMGPYKGDAALFGSLFEKLMKWAGPRGLLQFPETQVLSVYHDDPNVTDQDKLRVSACITIPEDARVDGEVGKMKVPGGKCAVARFEIKDDQYEESWNLIMGGFLPESGFQPDDRLCYELYHNNPEEHPEGKHILDIVVPVTPL